MKRLIIKLAITIATITFVRPTQAQHFSSDSSFTNTYSKAEVFDESLTGTWTYTEINRSGEFTNITVQKMIITPSGQLTLFEPTCYNSVPGEYFNDVHVKTLGTFQLETTDKKIYVLLPGEGKVFLASYFLNEYSLLTISEDGTRELWKKMIEK